MHSISPILDGLARTRLLLLAALIVMGTACGAVGQGAGPTPTPSENPMHFDVVATEKDKAVSVHVGQTLEVALHGGTSLKYQQVRTSDPAILEPMVDPAATAARGVTLAAFKAKGAGSAEVTGVGVPVCPAGQACPMFAILYTLQVTITP